MPDPQVSVIVPVHNGARWLARALESVLASKGVDFEVIVADDGSTDESLEIARRYPVQVISLGLKGGAAAARNSAASQAVGSILAFVDSDVIVPPGLLAQAVGQMEREPEIAALFGSYQRDSIPTNFYSRYKNLVHHYTHQNSSADACTFWSGTGFIRRNVFEAVGGFDEADLQAEDIDLGYRLHKAGYKIRLAKHLQVAHAKPYTLRSLLDSDLFQRAIPWTALMLRHRVFRSDLNTSYRHIASVGLALLLPFSLLYPPGFAALTVLFVGLNAGFFRLAFQVHGALFAAGTALLQWLIYCLSAAGAVMGVGAYLLRREPDRQREAA